CRRVEKFRWLPKRFVPLGTLALASVLVSAAAESARVTFVVRVPASTPAGSTLWLSGDRPELGTWNGAGLRLARSADGSWTGTLALPAATTFEYKVTRGDWETVEKDAQGGEIA